MAGLGPAAPAPCGATTPAVASARLRGNPAAPGAVVLGSGCPPLLTAERTAVSPALGFVGHWEGRGPGRVTQQVACRGYERLDSRGQIRGSDGCVRFLRPL